MGFTSIFLLTLIFDRMGRLGKIRSKVSIIKAEFKKKKTKKKIRRAFLN